MATVHVLDHPLIVDRLTQMRRATTPSHEFRRLLKEITLLMGYEVTKDFKTVPTRIQTPLVEAEFPRLADTPVTIVPILRAGLGLVDGLLELIPSAHVGHIGLQRDEETRLPMEYYCKMPPCVTDSIVIVVDPMLATGGSAIDAISKLKERGCTNIRMVNLLAAPEGVAAVQAAHPDVDIYLAAIDERLNEDAYVLPGIGDAGDRIFGTL